VINCVVSFMGLFGRFVLASAQLFIVDNVIHI